MGRLEEIEEKIRSRTRQKLALQEAIADAETNPYNADTQTALRFQPTKLLDESPGLVQELPTCGEGIHAKNPLRHRQGDRSIAIGGEVSGSKIVIGNNNMDNCL